MGGEGSMASAAASLKMNRAMLKKRSFRDLRESYIDASGKKTGIAFKEISAKELILIRRKIKNDARKDAIRQIGIYVLCTLLAGVILFLAYWLFVGL